MVTNSIPLDPLDLDALPPADADACGSCRGNGEVWTGRDEQDTGAPITAECGDCGGTGWQGGLQPTSSLEDWEPVTSTTNRSAA